MLRPLLSGLASEVFLSNLYCMGVAAATDPRQSVPPAPGIPPADVRVLRAKLILEEALETVAALGVDLALVVGDPAAARPTCAPLAADRIIFNPGPPEQADLIGIIDGCCDTNYVATGTLAACGVPDLPHLRAVNAANNAKFPGGKGIFRDDGKFLKPEGWTPPNHADILSRGDKPDFAKVIAALLENAARNA